MNFTTLRLMSAPWLAVVALLLAAGVHSAPVQGQEADDDSLYGDAYDYGYNEDVLIDSPPYDDDYGYAYYGDEEWLESNPYYSEDEWYDPTDWFDGNNYEYDPDEYEGYWGGRSGYSYYGSDVNDEEYDYYDFY